MRSLFAFFILAVMVAGAMAQPLPLEFSSHKLPDSLHAINGPDGKPLADGSLVYFIRLSKSENKPEVPLPGGLGKNEIKFEQTVINPNKAFTGELTYNITISDNDEFAKPHFALKGEKIILRAFASTDPKLPKGTLYADSPVITVQSQMGTVDHIQFGEWKKIP